MDQVAIAYRVGLIESIILLFLFVLAFGAVTTAARERWLALGSVESLLTRLAAAILLASIAAGGLSSAIIYVAQGLAFSDASLSPATSRNQAVLGIGLGLALAAAGVIRIEMYHRRLIGPRVQDEDAEWKVEPPEIASHR
jgi:hypothetical protein